MRRNPTSTEKGSKASGCLVHAPSQRTTKFNLPPAISCLDGSRVASDDMTDWRVVGSSLVFGLLVQPLRGLLALMESASWVPICNAGYDALDIRWGVPAPV